MANGLPMPPLVFSDEEIRQQESIDYSPSLPHSNMQRAQFVPACGGGESNTAIAYRMGLTQ
jgi:putative transposase